MTLTLQSKNGLFLEPQIKDFFRNFHLLSTPLQNNSLSNAWNNVHARKKLLKFFRQGLFRNDPELAESILKIIAKCAELELEDKKTISCLKRFLNQGDNQNRAKACYLNDEIDRAKRRALQISTLLRPKPQNFLDIGCGNGAVLEILTGLFKLSEADSVGTDVYDRTGTVKSFSYHPMNGKHIPFKSSSFDSAALLMTLHHEDQPEKLIQEAARVIKKGGRLIIRDHDGESIADNLFFEAMDTIYFSVINQSNEVPLSGKYRSARHWENVAHRAGFKTLKLFNPEPDNPMKPFHLLLIKE